MQIVKIQKTGGGQLYIHLPKFIERHLGLKSGQEVLVSITSPEQLQRIFENGEEVITIRLVDEEEKKNLKRKREKKLPKRLCPPGMEGTFEEVATLSLFYHYRKYGAEPEKLRKKIKEISENYGWNEEKLHQAAEKCWASIKDLL